MLDRPKVLRGVLVLRGVAAANVTAAEAETQVHPRVSHLEALSQPRVFGCNVPDLVEVRARHGRSGIEGESRVAEYETRPAHFRKRRTQWKSPLSVPRDMVGELHAAIDLRQPRTRPASRIGGGRRRRRRRRNARLEEVGGHVDGPPSDAFPSGMTSVPVRKKPRASRSTARPANPCRGAAPMKTKSDDAIRSAGPSGPIR